MERRRIRVLVEGEGTVNLLHVAMIVVFLGATASIPSTNVQSGRPVDIVIGDEETCEACRIDIEYVTTLTPEEDSGFLCSAVLDIAADATRFFVIDLACSDPAVLVFDRNGRQIRKLGMAGQGPGEFQRVRRIWHSGFLYVFEPGRLSIFSPSLEFQSAIPIRSVPSGFYALPNGRFVLADALNTPESVGLPFHLFGENGERLSSFGGGASVYRSDQRQALTRTLAASQSPGTLWAAYMSEYRIEKWDMTREMRLSTIERKPAWFVPSTSSDGPRGRLVDVREDEAGRLWTLISVPTSEREIRIADGGRVNEHVDTRVEVLDPDAGELLVGTISDLLLLRWAGEFTFSVREDANQNILVDVWRTVLQRRPD